MQNKYILALALGSVSLLAIGYGAGRYTTPEKVVETEKLKVVEVEKQVVVVQKEVEVKIVRVVEEKKDRVTTTTTETGKDGTSKTTIIEKEKTDTHVAEGSASTGKESSSSTTEKAKEVVKEVVKVVENLPEWNFGAGVGLELNTSILSGKLTPYGIFSVEKRIIGSFYGGAWGTTNGALGLGVSLGL
jgi:hypothetical protein